MKAVVASFGLDTARLLASTNQDAMNSEYGKMLIHFDNQYNDLAKNIVQEKDVRKKMDDINQQIKDINALNQGMVDRAMSKEVQKDLDNALQDIPSSTTYYRNYGDFPDHPSPGDMVWQSANWKNANANHMDAKLYEYYEGSGWKFLKNVDPNLYGVNINGASIKGGMISGGTFRSNQQGAMGTPFYVNPQGDIYASGFTMDLLHSPSHDGEVNPVEYIGTHLTYDGGTMSGLNFHNGMMDLKAPVYQHDGTYIGQGGNKYIGRTYTEPDYIKLRTYAEADEGSTPDKSYYGVNDPNYNPHPDTSVGVNHDGLIGRTDIRGGNIEVSNQWSQWAGIRIGYWQTDPDAPQSEARIALTSKNGNTLELTGDGIKLNGKPCGCFNGKGNDDDKGHDDNKPKPSPNPKPTAKGLTIQFINYDNNKVVSTVYDVKSHLSQDTKDMGHLNRIQTSYMMDDILPNKYQMYVPNNDTKAFYNVYKTALYQVYVKPLSDGVYKTREVLIQTDEMDFNDGTYMGEDLAYVAKSVRPNTPIIPDPAKLPKGYKYYDKTIPENSGLEDDPHPHSLETIIVKK